MAGEWGRNETVVWPPNKPIFSYGAIMMALVFTLALMGVRFKYGVEPLRQFYTPAYLRSYFGG